MNAKSFDEQLARWVAGDSVHAELGPDGEYACVPDFSCCEPELLAPAEVRQAFHTAPPEQRIPLLAHFLNAAFALAAKNQGIEQRVHVTTTGDREES